MTVSVHQDSPSFLIVQNHCLGANLPMGWGLGAGSTLHHAGPHKEAPLLLRKQRERGTCGENLYHGFYRNHSANKYFSRLSKQRRQWHLTPVLLPGKSHGWRSLVGCSPWGREESDMTERLHFHFSLSCIGEGNGNPLQCSCLENPREGGA